MIIVFFHVLYLIGKMVYENYHSPKRKGSDENDVAEPGSPTYFCRKFLATGPVIVEDDDDAPKAPRFSPPAYIQRYRAVQAVLTDPKYRGKIKKVVDYGCSELGFITYLKNTAGIEEILCVDVDRETLENYKSKAIPLHADYLQNRPNPLTINVYEGSVTHMDKSLANSDAVVAIELIEHLYPDTLMDLPYNIFGYVKPLVVAVTTPNADFNVLFPLKKGEMRHWDHKFEWTREQFEDWAKNITVRYPEYEVSFEGIGQGPPGTEHLGCCSQMAVFHRVREAECHFIYGAEGLFKLVTCQEYPYRIDNRSDEEKILDEAAYHIRRFSQYNSESPEQYPLKFLLERLDKFYISEEALRDILQNGGYAVEGSGEDAAILCPALSTFSDYMDELTDDGNEAENAWGPTYVDENLPYDNFGNWSEANIETTHDESWDDDWDEIPAITLSEFNEARDQADPYVVVAAESELSSSRSLDTADLNGIEISNVSHVPSQVDSIEPNSLPAFVHECESNQNATRREENDPVNPTRTENPLVRSNQSSLAECHSKSVINLFKSNNLLSQKNNVAAITEAQRWDEDAIGRGNNMQLDSLCSMYLEASRNEDRDVCPENITNPSFDCAALDCFFEESDNSVDAISSPSSSAPAAVELKIQSKQSTSNRVLIAQPQFTSSPRVPFECMEERKSHKHRCREEPEKNAKSSSQTSLPVANAALTSPSTSLDSNSGILEEWFPPQGDGLYKNIDSFGLKGGNEMTNTFIDKNSLYDRKCSSFEGLKINNAQEDCRVVGFVRQKTPDSLELRNTACIKDPKECLSILDTITHNTSTKEHWRKNAQNRDGTTPEATEVGNFDENLLVKDTLDLAETSESAETKTASPDESETPPTSWSPEIMDSGYPNSSSMQDMTPECDLLSISQERILDLESPGVAEAPCLAFLDHEVVENGDLANNNRDEEGNNIMAQMEDRFDENLEPPIDALENDFEIENDIYALDNGFPVWLLRILEQGFLDHAEVENGDLANNNRDDEGNDMIAEVELDEDLQPLINVLQNDLENENDIYALDNGFPLWLLRILERGNAVGRQVREEQIDPNDDQEVVFQAVGDAEMPDLDEGFDSTSSEDDNNIEISIGSGDEAVDWNVSGD